MARGAGSWTGGGGKMYVELHAHSYYSLLDGVPSPEALVQRAADLNMPALALTDRDALYGAPHFVQAAQQAGIKPILGAELTLTNGGGCLTLLAENDAGYANLCRLITLARRDQHKGLAALPWRALADHTQGLIALSGSRRGEIARALTASDMTKARRAAERFASLFGRHSFFLELQRHHERGDRRLNAGLDKLAGSLGLRLVATGNVHYLAPGDAPLHDVLTCIRHRAPLARANGLLRTNAEYYFRSPAEMSALFADWPDALRATQDIADRCNAHLPAGPQTMPRPPLPDGVASIEYLRHLCEQGIEHKGIRQKAQDVYRATLDRELGIIAEQRLADYFLIVWDLVRFARSQGILCQGRGSAANSLVAYLLDITPVDPLRHNLLFERFLSEGTTTPGLPAAARTGMPDIDVDFAADRREEVIQYVYERYGEEHVGMVCNVVTYRARSAVREAAKALAFPPDVIDRAAKSLDTH